MDTIELLWWEPQNGAGGASRSIIKLVYKLWFHIVTIKKMAAFMRACQQCFICRWTSGIRSAIACPKEKHFQINKYIFFCRLKSQECGDIFCSLSSLVGVLEWQSWVSANLTFRAPQMATDSMKIVVPFNVNSGFETILVIYLRYTITPPEIRLTWRLQRWLLLLILETAANYSDIMFVYKSQMRNPICH